MSTYIDPFNPWHCSWRPGGWLVRQCGQPCEHDDVVEVPKMGTCEDESNLTGVGLVLAVHLVHRSANVLIALVRFGYGSCPAEYTVRCRASRLPRPLPFMLRYFYRGPCQLGRPPSRRLLVLHASGTPGQPASRLRRTRCRNCRSSGVQLPDPGGRARAAAGAGRRT